MEINPIAHIQSDFKEKFGIPRQTQGVGAEGGPGSEYAQPRIAPQAGRPDERKRLEVQCPQALLELIPPEKREALLAVPWRT